MTTYESMTAKELHDLVTRLEAHGFKVPVGLMATNSGDCWYFDRGGRTSAMWITNTPFAAAIIEVAARDWWIARDRAMKPSTMIEWMTLRFDVAYGNGVSMHGEGPWDYPPELGEGMTPLHAIVAAVEAKEGK